MNNKTLQSFSDRYFDNNSERFKNTLKDCESKFERNECYSVKTTLRTKYVLTAPHDISITLTPKLSYTHREKDEYRLIAINRVISFFIILTGISIKDAVKGFISIYFYSLSSLYNFQFINRMAYLFVFLLFSAHFTYLFYSLICHPMEEISYRYVLKNIKLPRVRICYEIKQDLNENIFTKMSLDSDSLNLNEILESITLLDSNFEKLRMNADDILSNRSLIRVSDFYLDQFKCFNFDFLVVYHVYNINILESDKLLTFVLKLDKVPKERVFVYLNSENSLDFGKFLKKGTSI